MARRWTPETRREYNRRLVARKLAGLSPSNRDPASDFVAMKQAEGLASGSLVNLTLALSGFDAVIRPRPWSDTTPADAVAWLSGHRLNGTAESTVVNHRANIKQFLKHVLNTDVLPRQLNQAFRVRRNRSVPKQPVIPDEAITRLIGGCENLRDQALVSVLALTGARCSEIASLTLASFRFDDNHTGVWIDMPDDLEEGLKTGNRDVFVAGQGAAGIVHAYLSLHPERDAPDPHQVGAWTRIDNTGRLVAGAALTTHGVRQILHRRLAAAGLPPYRPHDFRHSAATKAYQRGLGVKDLCTRYGWSPKGKTVWQYVHDSVERQQDMARKAAGIDSRGHPLGVTAASKACAYCAEEIRSEAVKCKHCGEFARANAGPVD